MNKIIPLLVAGGAVLTFIIFVITNQLLTVHNKSAISAGAVYNPPIAKINTVTSNTSTPPPAPQPTRYLAIVASTTFPTGTIVFSGVEQNYLVIDLMLGTAKEVHFVPSQKASSKFSVPFYSYFISRLGKFLILDKEASLLYTTDTEGKRIDDYHLLSLANSSDVSDYEIIPTPSSINAELIITTKDGAQNSFLLDLDSGYVKKQKLSSKYLRDKLGKEDCGGSGTTQILAPSGDSSMLLERNQGGNYLDGICDPPYLSAISVKNQKGETKTLFSALRDPVNISDEMWLSSSTFIFHISSGTSSIESRYGYYDLQAEVLRYWNDQDYPSMIKDLHGLGYVTGYFSMGDDTVTVGNNMFTIDHVGEYQGEKLKLPLWTIYQNMDSGVADPRVGGYYVNASKL